MKARKLISIFLILICVVAYCASVIKQEHGPAFGINIDLAKPSTVVWPGEIAIIGDAGEKGFRIGPKVGRGWRGEAGGSASYKFFIPIDGRYQIWAYCQWYDECANAVFVQIDDFDKAIVGNDPLYNEWHWVRGFEIDLKKGTHTLTLSNHSDHIAVQHIFLSNSSLQMPSDSGITFSDVFYDGFDGCDRGNFAQWKTICGHWTVMNPESQTCFIENALVCTCKDSAFIIYPGDKWDNYSLDLKIRSLPVTDLTSSIGICFGLTDAENYYLLKIIPNQNGKTSTAQLSKLLEGKTQEMGKSEISWKTDHWHNIQIRLEPMEISVQIDGNDSIKVDCTGEHIRGGIGLMLKGEITAHFDDIHVREILKKD